MDSFFVQMVFMKLSLQVAASNMLEQRTPDWEDWYARCKASDKSKHVDNDLPWRRVTLQTNPASS